MNTFKVNHLHIICQDLQNMIAFWTTGLGALFKEYRTFGETEGAVLMVGNLQVNLRVPKDNEKSDNESGSCLGYDHVGFEVDDLNTATSHLLESGCIIKTGPTELSDRRIVFLNGPENITLELMEMF
jgi:catechol 2,3-dioxygenase-like lactoylglutathione lyase family enzyme